jgi:tRNA(Ile)-lysidine synthase TilS/MesJ
MTRRRIRGWVEEFGEDGVYVAFSGGKDSTVLLDIVRKDFPNVEAVFCNTGLEYPSIRKFAKTKENVTFIKPTIDFFYPIYFLVRLKVLLKIFMSAT